MTFNELLNIPKQKNTWTLPGNDRRCITQYYQCNIDAVTIVMQKKTCFYPLNHMCPEQNTVLAEEQFCTTMHKCDSLKALYHHPTSSLSYLTQLQQCITFYVNGAPSGCQTESWVCALTSGTAFRPFLWVINLQQMAPPFALPGNLCRDVPRQKCLICLCRKMKKVRDLLYYKNDKNKANKFQNC